MFFFFLRVNVISEMRATRKAEEQKSVTRAQHISEDGSSSVRILECSSQLEYSGSFLRACSNANDDLASRFMFFRHG